MNLSDPRQGVVHLVPILGIAFLILAVPVTVYLMRSQMISTAPKATGTTLKQLTENLLHEAKAQGGLQSLSQDSTLYQQAFTRKEAMVQAAKTNPKEFLMYALPPSVRNQLPTTVRSLVEEVREVRGTIQVLHKDDFQNKKSADTYFLTADNKKYELRLADKKGMLTTGMEVRANGMVLDNLIVAHSLTIPGKPPQEQRSPLTVTIEREPAQAPETYPHTTAVVLINAEADSNYPVTVEEVRKAFFEDIRSIDAIYREMSGNRISFTGRVLGWFDVTPQSSTSCDIYAWSDEVIERLRRDGIDPTAFTNVVFLTRVPSRCSYGGFAQVDGRYSWNNVYADKENFRYTLEIVVHELGHNIGINHANGYTCKDESITHHVLCGTREYADPSDPMGRGMFFSSPSATPAVLHFNAPHKIALGWVPQSEIQELDGTFDETVTLKRFGAGGPGLSVLKVKKPQALGEDYYSPDYYYLSLRGNTGLDTDMPQEFLNGISLHAASSKIYLQTQLVDATPAIGGAYPEFSDAPLATGQTVRDPNGVSITQVSHSSSSATIRVDSDPAICVRSSPQVEASNWYRENPNQQIFGLEVINTDTLGCETAIFTIKPRLPDGWTYQYPYGEPDELTAPAGRRTIRVVDVFVPTSAADGTYQLIFEIQDKADPSRVGSAQAFVSVFRNVAPSPIPTPSPTTIQKELTLKFKLAGRREDVGQGFAEPFRLTLIPSYSTDIVDLVRTTDSTGIYKATVRVKIGKDSPYRAELKARHSVPITMHDVVFDESPTAVLDFGTIPNGNARDDKYINILDFSKLASAFGTLKGTVRYNPDADFNTDGRITILDFSILAGNFGKGPITISPPSGSPTPRPVSAPVR